MAISLRIEAITQVLRAQSRPFVHNNGRGEIEDLPVREPARSGRAVGPHRLPRREQD